MTRHLVFLPLLLVGLYAYWPQTENPTGWCERYPAACAYEQGGAAWDQFVEDRRNGIR